MDFLMKKRIEELQERKRQEISETLRKPYAERIGLKNKFVDLVVYSGMTEEHRKVVLEAFDNPRYVNTHNPERYNFIF